MSKKMFIESKQMVKVEKCFTPSCYHRITMQLRKLSQEHWEIKQLVKNMSSKMRMWRWMSTMPYTKLNKCIYKTLNGYPIKDFNKEEKTE